MVPHETLAPAPAPAADKPLTPQNLLDDFGAGRRSHARALRRCWTPCTPTAARPGNDGRRVLAGGPDGSPPSRLGILHGWPAGMAFQTAGDDAALLFALQTYYAMLVKLLAERFGLGRLDEGLPNNPFSWCDSARSKAVDRLADRLRKTLAGYRMAPPADDGECDLFKPLYQNLFPRPLRHQLGEYYTPDWLAGHVLDQVGYTGEPGQRLLDPACGSGTFLLMALRRLRKKRGERREERGKETGNEGLGIRDWGLGTTAGVFSGRRHDRPLPFPSPLSPLPPSSVST